MWRSAGVRIRNQPGRYSLLLATILFMMVFQALFANHAFARAFAGISLTLILLVALYSFRTRRIFIVMGALLVAASLVSRAILEFHPYYALQIVAPSLAAIFLLFTVVTLVSRLFSVSQVTLDTISAAICAYLLMGIAWGFIFMVIETVVPGSFTSGLLRRVPGAPPSNDEAHNFVYYSFVCLTTTGYGDIAPVSGPARVMSILESIFGQLYLAILIARLVSLEVAQSVLNQR